LLSLARINKKENATNFGEQAKGGTRSPSLSLSRRHSRAVSLRFDHFIILFDYYLRLERASSIIYEFGARFIGQIVAEQRNAQLPFGAMGAVWPER